MQTLNTKQSWKLGAVLAGAVCIKRIKCLVAVGCKYCRGGSSAADGLRLQAASLVSIRQQDVAEAGQHSCCCACCISCRCIWGAAEILFCNERGISTRAVTVLHLRGACAWCAGNCHQKPTAGRIFGRSYDLKDVSFQSELFVIKLFCIESTPVHSKTAHLETV